MRGVWTKNCRYVPTSKKPVDWNDHKDSAWLLLLLKKLKKTFWSTDQQQNLEQEMKLELELFRGQFKNTKFKRCIFAIAALF